MSNNRPPAWAKWLIKWYSNPAYQQEILGDLDEMYQIWRDRKGPFIAQFLYIWNAILFFRGYNSRMSDYHTGLNQLSMIKHAFKLSLRNIRKHKVYSLGNILGLAIGISISLIIFIHVSQELSYEKDYPKYERIFRVSSSNDWAQSPPTFADELESFFSQIENVTRFARYGGYRSTCVVGINENQFLSNGIFQTDESVLEVFDIELLEGKADTALDRPYTIVLAKSVATKLFADQNPIGEYVEINNEKRKFEVTGVMSELPKKSHIKIEALVSMSTFYDQIPEEWTNARGWMVMHTYVLLDRAKNVDAFRQRMPDFTEHYFDEATAENMVTNGRFFEVMPIEDIHLTSDRTGEMEVNSNVAYVYIFATLAIFIIIIASVNFINIFTTLYFKRVKEIGLRKIVGAQRTQLVFQLLSEACVTAIIAAMLGLTLCLIFLPYYNSLVDLNISWNELVSFENLVIVFVSSILLGLLSGVYPSLLITRQNLSELILKNSNPRASISVFRKGLIVFQFVLSLFILISTVVVNRQMEFIQKQDLGFNTSQLVSLKMYGDLGRQIRKNHQSFFPMLEQHPNIQGVSMASNSVGESLSREYFRPVHADPERDYGATHMLWSDEKYLDVMGIELVKGRDFRIKTDTSAVFLVSEKIVENWNDNVLGTFAQYREEKGPIIGVFKNINFYSLHSEMEPIVICLKPSWSSNLLIRISGENMLETIDYIESRLREKSPNAITHFQFVDEKLDNLYTEENDMFFVFKAFSVLALIISCLGLLGIAAIEVQRRTKEVGIRKVLGASSTEILLLLSRQFFIILAISILIAIPLSYFSSTNWLADYSYRISLNMWDFLVPSIGLILISIFVVSLHSIRVMHANPTEVLRNE